MRFVRLIYIFTFLLLFFLELSRNLSFILFRFRKVVWDVSAR